AAAGIPVTLRGEVHSVTIVTGHAAQATSQPMNWGAIAAAGGTIVILMGAENIAEIATQLQVGGLPGDTPTAAVRWATTGRQEVVRATLASIGSSNVRAPATVVVGSLARLDLHLMPSALASRS